MKPLFDLLFEASGIKKPGEFARKAFPDKPLAQAKQLVSDYRSMPERTWNNRGTINARLPRKEMRFPDFVNLSLKMGFRVVVTFERIDTPDGSIENDQTD